MVSPELRACLKEQKPKTAEELGNLANLHVQSREGPLVERRYASTGSNEKSGNKNKPDGMVDDSLSEHKQDQHFGRSLKPFFPPARSTMKPEIKCYNCDIKGSHVIQLW